jgi:hypothetical protein
MMGRSGLQFSALFLLVSCGGGSGNGGGNNPPPVVNPPATPPAANVNISNPTLTFADNTAVNGGGLNLVWSDEFDAAQLDPEVWFFESGDGSQYGIPGWGNNELQWYQPNNATLANGLLTITAK